jgi:hypothetical protein
MSAQDPEALEARREEKRKNGRIRAKRFRDKARERAEDQIGQALTKLTNLKADSIPPAQHDLADQTARALLKRTCDRYGVDVEGIVRPIGEALHAQRVRKLARKVTLAPDFQSQLRASELGCKILERIGSVPDARSKPQPQYRVHITVYGYDEQSREITMEEPEEAE